MIWNPNQRMTETRYSATHPPSDLETAEQKLNELRGHVSHIDIDLEEREIESFPDETTYESWRKRARAALVHIKVEKRFLEKWIQDQKRSDALQMIATRVADLESDAQTRMSGFRQEPTNLEGAKRRLTGLTQLRDEISTAYQQMQELGKTVGLTRREVAEKLSSVRTLVEGIESARRTAKGFIQRYDPESKSAAEEPLPAPAQQILDFATTTAATLTQERPAISDPCHAPADLNETGQKRASVAALRSKVAQALQTVNAMWTDQPYAGGTLKVANQPLASLFASLDEEVRYLDAHAVELRRYSQEKNLGAAIMDGVERTHRNDELLQISQAIRKRAEELAAEISNTYTPLFTATNRPANTEEARQRIAIVPEIKHRVQAALAEITDAWCQHPLNRSDMSGVKRPLVAILNAIEVENAVAKRFIASQQVQDPTSGDTRRRWKSVCVAALTRAALEGFKLTDEERTVIQELLADMVSPDRQ